MTTILLSILPVIGFAAGVLLARRQQQMPRNDRKRLQELEALVTNLRELAYQHRELDSTLSTIITDEIRTFENHQRKELR